MNDEPKSPFDKVYCEALYRSIQYGSYILLGYQGEKDSQFHEGYVRVSEPVEFRIVPLRDESVIQNALSMLEAAEHNARIELEKKLAGFREQRAQLLALTHQTEAA